MAKYVFPAVFKKEEKYYIIHFPDIPGCNTQGENLHEALEMAEDALSLMLCVFEDNHEEIPKPSDIQSVKTEDEEFVSLIACDTLAYRMRYEPKTVKKKLAIPAWLNTAAEKAGIDFSATLQNALIAELHL